jgi:threonine aldolase
MRHVHGHGPRTPGSLLREAAQWCDTHEVAFDVYGTGEVVERFEAHVAQLLGFEAGRFLPSGVMAQNAALRVHAERAGHRHVGMHPTSHLEVHEERAYSHLWGLRATLVGPTDEPMRAEHLERVHEPLAALLVELPIREAGGQLPTWEQLEQLKQVAAQRGVPLHLDGARLWSCGPAYGRSLSEICAGFSTAYVSFYKSVGALSGAMLLGDRAFVDQAALWQRRAGGTLWSQIPSIATAAARLDHTLARMPEWVDHAKRLARAIDRVEGVTVWPSPPHTNLFHVVCRGEVADAVRGRAKVEEALGVRLFGGPRPGPMPGTWRTEISVMEAGLAVSAEDVAEGWRMVAAEVRDGRVLA